MVRIVPRQEHDGLLSYSDGIETVRDALEEHAAHPEYNETRHRVHTVGGVRVTVHQAVCPGIGGAGLMAHTEKAISDDVRQKYETKAHPVHVVHDADEGALRGVLLGELAPKELPNEGSVAPFRTACTSAVGVDALANPDATDLGVFGSGQQARNHLVAFSQVRDVGTVRVYSPTVAHREAFADEMTEYVDADIRAVDEPAAVIEGADVVLAATDASSPVFDGELLEPGQTVVSIVGSNIELVESGNAPKPRREIDDATVGRADVVVTNSVEQARAYRQADFVEPVEAGVLAWEDLRTLRGVVAGTDRGRRSADEIVLYKNNAGQGIADVALATRTLEAATTADLGTELDVFNPRV